MMADTITNIKLCIIWLCCTTAYAAFNVTLIYKGNSSSIALLSLSFIWYVIGISVLRREFEKLKKGTQTGSPTGLPKDITGV